MPSWEQGWKIWRVEEDEGLLRWSAMENVEVTEGRAPFAADYVQPRAEFEADGPWDYAVWECGWPAIRDVCRRMLRQDAAWVGALDLQHAPSLDEVRRLHDEGAPLDRLVAQRDALYYAAWLSRNDIALWLVGQGVPVDRAYPHGLGHRRTALHLATDVSVVDALLRAGADPNARTETGETPLHLVMVDDCWRPEVAQRLLDGGADPALKTWPDQPFVFDDLKQGWTPMQGLQHARLRDRTVRLEWLRRRQDGLAKE